MSIELNKINLAVVVLGISLILLSMLVFGNLDDVVLTQPTDNVEISGSYTLVASVTGHATQVSFYYQPSGGSGWNLIGTVANDTYPDTSFSYDWNTVGVSDGTYNLNATATNGTTSVSDTRTGIRINNVVTPDPTNLQVSDVLNDQGGKLYLSWEWSGDNNDLETFTIERKLEGGNWTFLANTTYTDYTDGPGLDNYETYCYHVRAVGTDGDISGWTAEACAEPNAEPIMDQVSITPDNPTVNDTVQCIGFMHDIDDSTGLSASYTISGIRWKPSSTISESGSVNCVPIISGQWPGLTPPPGATHECVVTIDGIKKGDKYTCYMTPYDGQEYGDTLASSTTYINNSRPWASDVVVTPVNATNNSTLTCNYTFNDLDNDQENTSAALFKWYRNIDGMNDWMLIEGQNGRTLTNTETETYFSKDDEIICSVKVKDIDDTWPGFENPLYDSQYRNSSVKTIGGNEEPGIINDWSDANTTESAVPLGGNVNFSVKWIDKDDTQERLMICEDFMSNEEQYSSGSENVSFGNTSTVWFYTNETGMIADTISIKPYYWEGKGIYWITQEDANSSSFTGTWTNSNNAIDGNWTTYANTTSGVMYVNYTKPTNAQSSSLWKVKGGNESATETNITISQSCWSQQILQFRANATTGTIYWDCYNGTGWENLNTTTFTGQSRIYEEAMLWDISSMLTTTNHTYDIYAYEVNESGSTDESILLAKVNDVAFTIGKYNTFKLEYSAGAYPNKYIGFKICIDSNNDGVCDNSGEGVYVHANSSGSYLVKEIGTSTRTLYDPEIKINYDTSVGSCKGISFCNITLTSDNPIRCSYNTGNLTKSSYTYKIRIFDPHGAASEIRSNIFYINRKPVIQYAHAEPQYPKDDQDIVCNFSAYDPDGDNITNETHWYYKEDGGDWSKYLSETDFINQSVTNSGETWMCEVTVTDELGLSEKLNSTVAVVGGSEINGTAPVIISITTNTNSTPINVGENINFTVYWDMANKTGKKLNLFICNSSKIGVGGCGGRVFYQSSVTGEYLDSPEVVTYQTNETDNTNQTYYAIICSEDECSNIYQGSFYVNHRPFAYNVSVSPQNANQNSLLNCTYIYNSSDSGISDSENTTLTSFRWYDNGILVSQNKTISGIFSTYDNISCTVKVVDVNGLSDDEYINSSTVMILPYPDVPKVWALPNLTRDNEINVIGYVGNALNVTVQNLDENNTPRFDYSTNLKSTKKLGESTVAEAGKKGNNYIKINIANGFATSSYLKIASHDLDNFLYYNITGVETIKINDTNFYRLTITPVLKEDVKIGTAVYAYNDSYPNGWFNITTNLWNGTNEIGVWGTNSIDDGEMVTKTVYHDVQPPEFNLSSVPDGSISEVNKINFNVTDDYELNLSTILVNVTNSTSVVKVYTDENISCNETYVSSCNLTLDLNEGSYNLTFSVNDTAGNVGSAVKEFVVDTTVDSAPEINIKDNLVHDTKLFMSWSPADVYALEYTVGEEPYPHSGWNSVLDWTNATEDEITNGNLTTKPLDLVNDETYYFNVKYKRHSWSDWSLIGSSPSIKYIASQEPAQPPTSVEVTAPRELHTTMTVTANWTESQASPGYEISYYEFAVGTAKYHDSGWNDTTNGWINNGLNRTVSIKLNLTNRETYYFNVRAVDTAGLESNVSSSGPITYYNQESPTATVMSVENDTVLYDGWLDDIDNNYTNITIHGNRNITCYYSLWDRDFATMEFYNDSKCNASGEWGENLTCQIPNLDEDAYTYYISCEDSDEREQSNTENTEVSFDVDYSGPKIAFIYPKERNFTAKQGKFGLDDTFLFNVTDKPGGVALVNFTIFNNTWSALTNGTLMSSEGNYSYKWNNENYPDGNYSIFVQSEDSFEHYSSYLRNFTLDKTPPNITLDIGGVVNNSYFHKNFNITTRIQDFVNASYGVVGTSLSNSTNSTGYGNDYNWTSLINVTGLNDGLYTIEYNATDSVNNFATASLNFYVDKHAWFNSTNPIANYTWLEDTNLTDVIDLDNHFAEVDDNVSYSFSGNENITVLILKKKELQLSSWNNSAQPGSGDVVIEFSDTSVTLKNANATFYQNVSVSPSTKYSIVAEHKANNTSGFEYELSIEEYNSTGDLVGFYSKEFSASESWKEINFTFTTGADVSKIKIDLNQKYLASDMVTLSQWRNIKLYEIYGHPHLVSLISNRNWNGIEYVTFYANDSYGVSQPSNTVKLEVTDDYCNPPTSGTWVVNQSQIAQCRHVDQDILNEISNVTVIGNSTINMTDLEMNVPIYFTDNSIGYSMNNIFHKTIYLKDNSSLTAWNTSFSEVILSDNATLSVYNSPGTIRILNVVGNQNLELNNTKVGDAYFTATNGEIKNSDMNSSTFYINGTGEVIGMTEGMTDGYINSSDMTLNFTNVNVSSINLYALSGSSLNVTNSSFSLLSNEGKIRLKNSEIETLTLRGNSITDSTNSTVGTLESNMSVGEVSVIRGNISIVNSSSISSGEIVRYYPVYIYNGKGAPLSNVNTTLSSEAFTSGGFSTVAGNYTSSVTKIPLYTDGLNLKNVTMIDDTPLNITSRLLDPDGDGTSILNDPDDDNDGINDTEDFLTGNASWIETNTNNLNVSVNGTYNLTQKFNETLPVNVSDVYGTITKFNWNFTGKTLGLQYLNITKGRTSDQREYLIISGLDLPGDTTKTVYLNKTTSSDVLCIYDKGSVSVSSITVDTQCSGGVVLTCPGVKSGYSCSLIDDNTTFNITGLRHSGVIQLLEAPATTTTTATTTTVLSHHGGGGGGGGGGPPISVNVSEEDVDIENIAMVQGTSKVIDIGDWNGKVYKIVVYSSQPISRGYIKIHRLNPWSIWEVPSLGSGVYHYLKIDSNLENKTSKVEFYFSVDKLWIERNSIKNVYLWRYKGRWNKLITEKVGESDGEVNYKSSFSSFSHFAVKGERATSVVSPKTTTTVRATVCGNGICESEETSNSCPEDCRQANKTDMLYIVIPTIFLVFVIIVGISKKVKKSRYRRPTHKELKLPPPPPMKIKEIISNSTNYIGKNLVVDGDIKFVEFSPEENKVLYRIRDDTGTMEGFSRKTDYHGHSKIQGTVKRKGDKIYLYF